MSCYISAIFYPEEAPQPPSLGERDLRLEVLEAIDSESFGISPVPPELGVRGPATRQTPLRNISPAVSALGWVKSSDIRKDKSAGYRVIYYLKTGEQIILATIYSKSDQSDVDAESIRNAIAQLNL